MGDDCRSRRRIPAEAVARRRLSSNSLHLTHTPTIKTLAYLACFASAAALAFAQQNTNANDSVPPITPADEAAIRALSKAYEQACNEKAWAKAAAIFADDSIFLPPHSPKIVGRLAAEAFLRGFPPFKDLWIEPLEIHGRGDLAYVRGRYAFVGLPPNQPEQRDTGKYAEIWRKQPNGAWKLDRDIFNSDHPISVPPSQGTGVPNIAGTYKLVSRKLPDGRMIYPPAITGLYSITSTTINFNIVETQSDGKVSSGSSISTYRLTEKEFVPTRQFSMMTEDGKVTLLDRSSKAESRPAIVRGSRIEFTPPAWNATNASPLHVFDGNTLVATAAGEFIDTWEKVDDSAATSGTEAVVAAVKAAVEKHWAAINGNDTATVDRQHTLGISIFLADIEPRMRLNSPAWLGLLQRWQGAKANWMPREIEVQPLSATVAAASFYVDGSVRCPDGSVDSRPRRVTEIWVNDNGTWKEAHHHDSVYSANPKPAAAQ
ncbi:MAG: DUF4440 domain-containing protein [Verrucomicrobia bacterium]|nr:DUF4440 domain-containing protein [Verrucomicrobiota bacterium]